MNAATVSRVMSLIPERVTRAQTGTAFADVRAASCEHPERIALVAEFLHWLSPIYPTTKDDQKRLGLFAHGARPILQPEPGAPADEGDLEDEAMLDETLDETLDEPLDETLDIEEEAVV